MRRGSCWIPRLAIVAAAVVLAACASSPSTTSSGGSTTATTAPSTAGTGTGAPTGSTTCRATQLQASRVGSAAAAGHIVVTYGLRNTSIRACTLLGYPGVQMVDAFGRALPTQVAHGGSYTFAAETPSMVALPPSAQASFFLGYSDVPSGNETSCAASARLDITPPGDNGAIAVADQIAPCGNGAVTVSPVHAGAAPPP
jgi:hypothetical protein